MNNMLKRFGLARVLSKMGWASRSQAVLWVADGIVQVNGRIIRNPEFPVCMGMDTVSIMRQKVVTQARMIVMLNKPRGVVTTRSDEHQRATVYGCLSSDLPWLAPVGRLDKASEGLLLFSNDPIWAASITDPEVGPDKTYHVQIDQVPDSALLTALETGSVVNNEFLRAKQVKLLRHGAKNAWLEIVLDEGRNRQIRRLLEAFDIRVLRLIRVAIGGLLLGDLPKGQWRILSDEVLTVLKG
jgi:23S rRNA pseudouridine2605 synthase